ncbi:MAG TPA: SRPBCC family protein [Caulobacteraceae bacterium]
MVDQVEKSVILRAPIDRVWQALSDAGQFGQWFGVKLDGAFAPGQTARGNITNPGYEHLEMEVKVVRMERPRLFSFTWHPFAVDPKVDYSGETPTLVEFTLEAMSPGETRLRVVESGFASLPEHRRAEALLRNEGGWAAQMTNIKAYVEP